MSKTDRLAVSICLIFFYAWSWLLCFKYNHLGYYDWDLAFFTQACWQLIHGSQYVPVTGINYFGDHAYFITFLTLPFFWLVPHPLTLLFLKICAFMVSAFMLYKIASRSLGGLPALALMAIYLIFPANVFSLLYEYNPESLAPPLLFWIFMALEKKQWGGFLTASCLLMMIKENMVLLVCAFALYALIKKDFSIKRSLTLFVAAALFFCVLVLKVIPYFRHLPYHAFVVRYAYLGHSIPGILWNLLAHPQLLAKSVCSSLNAHYMAVLFGPMLLPAIVGWQQMLVVLPVLMQHLLSSERPEHTIYYHYGTTITPFIFMAAISALKLCYRRYDRKIAHGLLALLLILCFWRSFTWSGEYLSRLDYSGGRMASVGWSFVNAIPRGDAVIATFNFLAPLSTRRDLYAFYKIYSDNFQNPEKLKLNELNTGRPFLLPQQVHWALIDFNDSWIKSSRWVSPQATDQRINAFLANSQWKVVKQYGSIVLLER